MAPVSATDARDRLGRSTRPAGRPARSPPGPSARAGLLRILGPWPRQRSPRGGTRSRACRRSSHGAPAATGRPTSPSSPSPSGTDAVYVLSAPTTGIPDGLWPLDLALGIVACLLIWWTRRYPRAVALLLVVPGSIAITAGFATLVGIYRVGLLARPRGVGRDHRAAHRPGAPVPLALAAAGHDDRRVARRHPAALPARPVVRPARAVPPAGDRGPARVGRPGPRALRGEAGHEPARRARTDRPGDARRARPPGLAAVGARGRAGVPHRAGARRAPRRPPRRSTTRRSSSARTRTGPSRTSASC